MARCVLKQCSRRVGQGRRIVNVEVFAGVQIVGEKLRCARETAGHGKVQRTTTALSTVMIDTGVSVLLNVRFFQKSFDNRGVTISATST